MEIFRRKRDVDIVVPRYKTLVTQSTDTCTSNTKIAKIILLTRVYKVLENHTLNTLQVAKGFFIIFAHYRPSYILL